MLVRRVAALPSKPLMVFDGDCNFCKLWIRRWQQMTGGAVDYLPSQDSHIAEQFPEIPRGQFEKSVQLIESDGEVFCGADAVFRALAKNSNWQSLLRFYESSPAFANFTERAYEFVAGHRTAFSFFTRLFWGKHVERPDYFLTRWIFLRALGAIYLVAFISLWTQIAGLIGHDGILPTDQFMPAVKQQCDAQGIGLERYYLLPTMSWFDASDNFLNFQCAAGTLFAILLIVGVAPAPCLALLWLIYLSLSTVSRDFLGFQWDNLLLEAGFLAIFFAPLQMLPKFSRETPPSKIILWLVRILLFKLIFSSGCVKLLSGDPNWRNLTALTFHYQTQPLPTWIGWYAQQLPPWFQKFSCAIMFAIELGAPFLIFAPRRIRFFGCGAIVFLQILILLTGNYTFFNFLTIGLCLLLLDDFLFQKILPRKWAGWFLINSQPSTLNKLRWPRAITIPLAAIVLFISILQMISMFGVRSNLLFPVAVAAEWLQPLRTVNSYGLFAVMTTTRNEIIVDGSDDGTNWLAYEFKYKPGDVNRSPDFVEPFQPRLDWQMWFAALSNYQQNPWFGNFCERLLQGSPEVLALLQKNPFQKHPPRYIRAELYDYHFTNFAERRATGAWWKREFIGEYLPPISLSDLEKK
ncbi:MAG TPA: lipase maturation factor family protein [Verrucomicrobiae bacterium]|jgi:predicted DCC family thiol-disulfide oxidoreductase YuxK